MPCQCSRAPPWALAALLPAEEGWARPWSWILCPFPGEQLCGPGSACGLHGVAPGPVPRETL